MDLCENKRSKTSASKKINVAALKQELMLKISFTQKKNQKRSSWLKLFLNSHFKSLRPQYLNNNIFRTKYHMVIKKQTQLSNFYSLMTKFSVVFCK